MPRSDRPTGRRVRATAAAALLSAGAFTALVNPAAAANGASSKGNFVTYAAGPGLGYDISGNAQLVRTASGRTIASVQVRGLTPGLTYGVHVHAGTCAQLQGHYFFPTAVPDGDGPGGDELWPGPLTANNGGNAKGHSAVGATAGPEAASVVIHQAGGTARIACADLG